MGKSSTSSGAKSPKPRRRRLRRLLIAFASLLIVLALLVVLTPTFVSWGLGQNFIRGAIEKHVQGVVSFDRLTIGWRTPLAVDGFAITDRSGTEAVNLTVHTDTGLLGLVLSRPERITVDITGAVRGAIREDGSTSLGELVPSDREAARKPKTDEPFSVAGIPSILVRLDDLSLTLVDTPNDITYTFDEINGELSFDAVLESAINLTGRATTEDTSGSFTIDGAVADLFDSNGRPTLQSATGSLEFRADNVLLPLDGMKAELLSAVVTAKTTDPTKTITVSVKADARIDGDPSRFEAQLAATELVQPDGAVSWSLDQITGAVTVRSAPTRPLQALLGDLPIVLARDLGETVDIDASFSVGETKDVSMTLTADRLTANVTARLDPSDQSIAGESLAVRATVSPDLLEAMTGYRVAEPADIELSLDRFAIPAPNNDGERAIADLGASGSILVHSELQVSQDEALLATVKDLHLDFESDLLRQGISIKGGATIDGGTIAIEERIDQLFDADGALSLSDAQPIGVLAARGIPGETIKRFVTSESPVMDTVLADPLTATVYTTAVDGNLQADVTAALGPHKLNARAVRLADKVQVADAKASVLITPQLAELLQADSDDAIVLVNPAMATLRVTAFELTATETGKYELPVTPIEVALSADTITLDNIPAMMEKAALSNLQVHLVADLAQQQFDVKGQARAVRVDGDRNLARVDFDVSTALNGDLVRSQGTATLTNLAIVNLEQMIGQKRGVISQWLGRRGNVTVGFGAEGDQYQTTVTTDLPYVQGEFTASLANDVLSLHSDQATITIQQPVLEAMLNSSDTGSGDQAAHSRVTVAGNVPFQLAINELRFPLAMLREQAFDPTPAALELSLKGGPLDLRTSDGSDVSLRDLDVRLVSRDFSNGVRFTVAGTAVSDGAAEPGQINLEGRVGRLLNDKSVLNLEAPRLNMTGTVSDMPTQLADALLDLDGLLVAAIGPQMNSTMNASGFSRNSGQLDARFETVNGWLGGVVKGRRDSLRIDQGAPVKGRLEVTPPLRERLLARIHPVLADIRSTEQPIRISIDNAVLPLDGDLTKLKADIDITVGAVEFDSGSATLVLLKVLQSANAETIPGRIEPIKAKIRKGIVTYDRFNVVIGNQTMAYSGQIDLNTGQVDLRTELPLQALVVQFKELGESADDIVVPLVTHGRFGDLTTEIDPDSDLAQAALEAAGRKILDDLLKDGLRKKGGG